MEGAVRVALGLLHLPSQVRLARAAPLPDDVLTLLTISSGDEETLARSAVATERTREEIKRASDFYIEQILLSPESDAYRILGAPIEASTAELRRNMALLLRWLHPDMGDTGERLVFVTRVTGAWENVKTPERRATYDANPIRKNDVARKKSRDRKRRSQALLTAPRRKRPGFLMNALWLLLRRRHP